MKENYCTALKTYEYPMNNAIRTGDGRYTMVEDAQAFLFSLRDDFPLRESSEDFIEAA